MRDDDPIKTVEKYGYRFCVSGDHTYIFTLTKVEEKDKETLSSLGYGCFKIEKEDKKIIKEFICSRETRKKIKKVGEYFLYNAAAYLLYLDCWY